MGNAATVGYRVRGSVLSVSGKLPEDDEYGPDRAAYVSDASRLAAVRAQAERVADCCVICGRRDDDPVPKSVAAKRGHTCRRPGERAANRWA